MAPSRSARTFRITAAQRLGKRVDRLDDLVRGYGRDLEALNMKVAELRQELAGAMPAGNWEAMYRVERDEVLRLRQNGHGVDRDVLLRWIAELDRVCWRLNPTRIPPSADADVELTDEERRIVQKFGIELARGLGR